MANRTYQVTVVYEVERETCEVVEKWVLASFPQTATGCEKQNVEIIKLTPADEITE